MSVESADYGEVWCSSTKELYLLL